MNIDYTNLKEILVKTQKELDSIPLDFKGRIYINFGTTIDPAIIKNKCVTALGNSSIKALENSSIKALENSSVVAWGNSSVLARGNSSVIAWEKSSVVARENSSVEARENSSVEAWENSSVEASGNSQIVDKSYKCTIKITGNARIVHMPKTAEDYCVFYNLDHNKNTGKFYKCVHKINGKYFSDKDNKFEYAIGQIIVPDYFDNDTNEDCGHGIHAAYLDWAIDYGKDWKDLAILEVEANLNDIIIPVNYPGKVRCKEVKVLREVPLEECGLCGKILAKKLIRVES